MPDSRSLGRVETGVPGLDTILQGGLFQGGVYIVEGPPGSGKTILGNQICFHRASRGDSTISVTLLAESHVELRSQLYRLISIVKVRDRAYDGAIREFQITDRGVVVADTFDSAEQILTGTARIVAEPEFSR